MRNVTPHLPGDVELVASWQTVRARWVDGPSPQKVLDTVARAHGEDPPDEHDPGRVRVVLRTCTLDLTREVSPRAVGLASLVGLVLSGCEPCGHGRTRRSARTGTSLLGDEPGELSSYPELTGALELAGEGAGDELLQAAELLGALVQGPGRLAANMATLSAARAEACRLGHLGGLLAISRATRRRL